MDMNDIKTTLESLDPLKISETYDRMKDSLQNAGLIEVPRPVPESTVVHRSGGLPTGAALTPREVAQMMHPNTPSGHLTEPLGAHMTINNDGWTDNTIESEPTSPDVATVKATSTKQSGEIHDSFAPVVSPHFSTTYFGNAQTMALANAVKGKLTEEKEAASDVPLYEQFDDTLTKLFEEIENTDVLSDGQKSALLMKVHMTSANILKKKYEVNV